MTKSKAPKTLTQRLLDAKKPMPPLRSLRGTAVILCGGQYSAKGYPAWLKRDISEKKSREV